MKVTLVSVSQSQIKTKEGDRFLTPEEHIVYCARVSNPANQLNLETAPKLLKHCITHKHWSIFEQADFTVGIETSRGIAPQIIRHKSFSFQEFSQRYSEVTALEPLELRKQAEKNRQSSTDIIDDPVILRRVEAHLKEGLELYKNLADSLATPASTRSLLPLTAQTTLYMKGTARSWIHYLETRCALSTQKEHRLIAEEVMKIFVELFPNISKALDWTTN